ncbi:MAG TPA: NAD-dependent epimerase/dehydratase family protein [Thermomicrobiales bacterium]|jgi:nucleoside-diphosphate-sugar epimerase
MKVAVTGGTGFIGRHVVAALATAGHEVTVVARTISPVAGAAQVVQGEVTDRAIGARFAGMAAIVHLAAIADASLSAADPVGYTTVNALGTLNVLEGARQHGAGVVFASSQRVYEPWHGPLREDGPLAPTTVYGWGKLAAEGWVTMYRQLYAVPTATLRLFSVYGPGQRTGGGVSGVVAIFAERALSGLDLAVHQRHLRDFVYVTDVAAAIVRTVERLRDPVLTTRVYNIGSGIGTGLDELAEIVRERSGMAERIAITGGGGDAERREEVYATLDRARQELDWSPRIDLTAGVDRYLAWLRPALASGGRG